MNQIDFKGLNNFRIKFKKVRNIVLLSSLLVGLIISFVTTIPLITEIITRRNFTTTIFIFFFFLFLFVFISYSTFRILDYLFVRPFERLFYLKYMKFVSKGYLLKSIRDNFFIYSKTYFFFENYIKASKGHRELSDSKLFKYTHFNLEERFEGKMDELEFAVSKINLERKIHYLKKENVFDGFHLKINYELNPSIFIEFTNKTNEFSISSVFKKTIGLHVNSKHHDYLYDNYEIFISDKNLILQLLSNEFVESLMRLNSIIGDKVIFKIRDGFVYVAFNDTENCFEIDYKLEVEEIYLKYSKQLNNLFKKLNEIKKFIDCYLVNKISTSSNIS